MIRHVEPIAVAEGRLPGQAGEFRRPPAALQGRLPDAGAFDRAGRGFAGGDFRREGRGGVNLSARTWAAQGRNPGIIAVIVLAAALINRLAAEEVPLVPAAGRATGQEPRRLARAAGAPRRCMAFKARMSTPNAIVGEQKSDANRPLRNAASHSSRPSDLA